MIIERITSYRFPPIAFAVAIVVALLLALYTHVFDDLVTP